MATNQRDLDFALAEQERSREAGVEKREDKLDDLIGSVVDRLGPKHFAEQLGIGLKNVDRIYHWRQRRNGQRPPAELLLEVVKADEEAMASFCDLAGYEPAKRKVIPVSPEEQLKRYRAALLQFGSKGEELDRQIQGRGRE